MKEIEPKKTNDIQNVKQAEVKKQLKFIGSEKKIIGLRLYEYNEITKEIKEAEYMQKDYILDFTKPDPAKDLLSKRMVKVNSNCIYIQAMNKKNALKKITK